jgi:diphosphomevalonate decarboxylase
MEEKEVTCSAPVNIAVIKYWGKRDTMLILPTNSSLSVTLSQNHLKTITTIRAGKDHIDRIYLNGIEKDINSKRLYSIITLTRKLRRELEDGNSKLEKLSEWGLLISSFNNFPTAAGLASSASGYACLTFALTQLYDLKLSQSDVSKIARMGSGSACRSVFGGFVKWEMGILNDGSDSVAVQVASEKDWNLHALILVVSDAQKDIGSTVGMQETVETSELFQQRINLVPKRIKEMEDAIKRKDFNSFAELTMKDSNQFHACCADTYPPIFYLNEISKVIIRVITLYNSLYLRNGKGYQACYTFDAGPNAVIYMPKDIIPQLLGLLSFVFPYSGQNRKDYYGQSEDFLSEIDQEELRAIATELGLKIYPNALSRIIHTSVGDGPRLLSTQLNSEYSLLDRHNLPKNFTKLEE